MNGEKGTIWHRLWARFYHLRGMAHRHLGHLQGDRVEYRLAVADFTRAIQRDGQFVQALYDRGLVLWRELGQGTQAALDLSRVIELAPERTEAWFNRAFARQMMGDSRGAVADFEHYQAHGVDPMWQEIAERQLRNLRMVGTEEERRSE